MNRYELDIAIQKFATYVRDEGYFDELDLKDVIERQVKVAVRSYRATILSKNYDSMHGTYDFNGIAEMVINRELIDE